MIKIYTDKSYLIQENKNLIFPLFNVMITTENTPIHNSYCFVNTIEECDVLILPLDINFFFQTKQAEIFKNFRNYALMHDKKLWVYSSGDTGITIKDNFIFVFKMADFRSHQNTQTVIMPVFIDDPLLSIYSNSLTVVSKTPKPIIGYVGHAKSGFKKWIITILIYLKENYLIAKGTIYSDYYRLYFSSHKRLKYLKIIQSSSQIVSKFIFRDKYRAGVKTIEDRTKTTLEFFDNIKNSQYTFCMRGGGNFSVRFYETLAMGRIPLFIDTDCILPLENIVDWKEYCIIVDHRNINEVNERLISFHNSISDEELIKWQEKNRIIWEKYLTRANYFLHIHDLFINKKL